MVNNKIYEQTEGAPANDTLGRDGGNVGDETQRATESSDNGWQYSIQWNSAEVVDHYLAKLAQEEDKRSTHHRRVDKLHEPGQRAHTQPHLEHTRLHPHITSGFF